jgi:hypothetical protein
MLRATEDKAIDIFGGFGTVAPTAPLPARRTRQISSAAGTDPLRR